MDTIKFNYFIGIDVSKNELDYAVMRGKQLLFHRERKNNTTDINAFLKELRALPAFKMSKAVFCMEHTGFYGEYLLQVLEKKKGHIVLENPLQIKRSIGLIRGKDDRRDSIRIAGYAQKNSHELRFWVPRRPVINELTYLLSLRNRVTAITEKLKVSVKEHDGFMSRELRKRSANLVSESLEAMQKDQSMLEQLMEELIDQDERLKHLRKLIVSVPCIGAITAFQVIITTNEFISISCPKKFACHAGIAPFKSESGVVSKKGRISPIGDKKIKWLLHLCALVAIRWDDELKAYYQRKTSEGKPKLVVINAVRNKLLLRVFACVNQNRPYVKDYQFLKARQIK
jgi:transposase